MDKHYTTRLPGAIQQLAERGLGEDFSHVQVVIWPDSQWARRGCAFAMHEQINISERSYERAGEFRTRLLIHELAHVVQKRPHHCRGIEVAADSASATMLLESEAHL